MINDLANFRDASLFLVQHPPRSPHSVSAQSAVSAHRSLIIIGPYSHRCSRSIAPSPLPAIPIYCIIIGRSVGRYINPSLHRSSPQVSSLACRYRGGPAGVGSWQYRTPVNVCRRQVRPVGNTLVHQRMKSYSLPYFATRRIQAVA